MLLQATAGSAALLQDVRAVHHYSVSVRGVAVALSWRGGGRMRLPLPGACVLPLGWGRTESSLCLWPPALSWLLHADVCVPCEFSAAL